MSDSDDTTKFVQRLTEFYYAGMINAGLTDKQIMLVGTYVMARQAEDIDNGWAFLDEEDE